MKDWFNRLLDFKHDVIGLVEELAGGRFTPKVLDRIFFLPLEVGIIFEYNNFSMTEIEIDRRCGVCVFEYGESDYILFSESEKFKIGSCHVYKVNNVGMLGLGNLLTFVISNNAFWVDPESVLLAHRIYKDRKILERVIPECGSNSVLGTVKV